MKGKQVFLGKIHKFEVGRLEGVLDLCLSLCFGNHREGSKTLENIKKGQYLGKNEK